MTTTPDTLAKLAACLSNLNLTISLLDEHQGATINPATTASTLRRYRDDLAGILTAQALPAGEPTRPANSQQWAGMDGATAFQLIERHADGWADIALMMSEWLAANQAAQQAAQATAGPDIGLLTISRDLVTRAAHAINWHLEPNSPDEHESTWRDLLKLLDSLPQPQSAQSKGDA